MSKEKEMIEIINKHMPKSPTQLNKLFESDAEIIDFQSKRLAYSMDEFSEEDLLSDEDAYTLGWNMAVGCISDILASGGNPKYYAHSLAVNRTWTKEYIEKLSMGIGKALEEAGMSFIGGDFSIAKTWRYTGSIIGELIGNPLLRRGAKVGDLIFISGRIGAGNIDAALKLYWDNPRDIKIPKQFKSRFKLRKNEALLIKEFAHCCIDTSDGVLSALKAVSDINETGYKVSYLPYKKRGIFLAKLLNLPKELLFFGGCGEYELLFTISKEASEDFLIQSKKRNFKFYKIGEIKEKDIQLLHTKEKEIDLNLYDLCARDYENPKDYLKDAIHFLHVK